MESVPPAPGRWASSMPKYWICWIGRWRRSGATAELGRVKAQANEAGSLRDEEHRLMLRVGELQSGLDRLAGSYDQERHETVLRETRALESLALQAERFRAVT